MMNNSNEQFSFTFPKSEKLKSKIEIDTVFQSGIVVKSFPFRLLFIPKSGTEPDNYPQVLISVPKRKHKHAVTRNHIKRRIREAYRLNKPFFSKIAAMLGTIFKMGYS